MRLTAAVAAAPVLSLLSACGTPDTKALQTLACQQAANTVDLQSVAQLDLLRKALGVAPGVDPIGTCKALGVTMTPNGASTENAGEAEAQGEQEN
jgi:hypothetical protein